MRAAGEALGVPAEQVAHAGLNYGETLAINGDYFGSTVNLAARLAATVCDPLTLKGFDAPVTACQLDRRR